MNALIDVDQLRTFIAIVETGSHAELITRRGYYSMLHEMQFTR